MNSELMRQLKQLAEKTIADCTHTKQAAFSQQPMDFLLPSGDEKYYAFWVRDSAMMAGSHLVKDSNLRRYLELIATYGQNGPETRPLRHGLELPPYVVTDHINYTGGAVFFPGTYSDTDFQGDGIYGNLPPLDDNYYFVAMVGDYVSQTGDTTILQNEYAGVRLTDHIKKAAEGYYIDSETDLVYSPYKKFAVNWGFVDSVAMEGRLLFASLLRWNAMQVLEKLFPGQGYADRAEKLASQIVRVFYDEATGWFWCCDAAEKQHDVWGTAFAVYLGLLNDRQKALTSQTLKKAYQDGVGVHGYIRHILHEEDAVPGVTAWARCTVPVDLYQNGTYWATPLGWFVYTVGLTDLDFAEQILQDFLCHTRDNMGLGTPYEWMSRDGSERSGLHYGTSGVLPYLGYLKLCGLQP